MGAAVLRVRNPKRGESGYLTVEEASLERQKMPKETWRGRDNYGGPRGFLCSWVKTKDQERAQYPLNKNKPYIIFRVPL